MSTRAILDRFDAWRAEGQPLVLATVIETSGSTYTKAGHRIVIAADGRYQGLVSGGCLEGDLALHARDVLADGRARAVTYDLRGEAEELFGLGIGCEGLLRVLLQRLDADAGYEPLATLAATVRGTTPGISGVVTVAMPGGGEPGATLVLRGDEQHAAGLTAAGVAALANGIREAPDLPALVPLPGGGRALVSRLAPLPRLLVLGAGLDAPPLVRLAVIAGLEVTVFDHRPAYLERGDLAEARQRLSGPPDSLASALPLDGFDAAVLMSHHLATDRRYLEQLAASAIPYVALLGPRGRRDRLLKDLGGAGLALRARLHGPAGLDIGADSPEAIALAILAEFFAVRSGRAGGSLDEGPRE